MYESHPQSDVQPHSPAPKVKVYCGRTRLDQQRAWHAQSKLFPFEGLVRKTILVIQQQGKL